jgi:hypothetical protein
MANVTALPQFEEKSKNSKEEKAPNPDHDPTNCTPDTATAAIQ